MVKGLFKFVFGVIGAVVITAVIFLVSLVIGHAVTGSWDMREWTSDNAVSAVVTEYQSESNVIAFDN